jgi:hypothetical protein
MSNKNLIYKRIKERAKKHNLPVELTISDITISNYCPILGIELHVNKGMLGGRSNSPSIDRKDSTKGYTKDNVWIISQLANQMKSNATPEQLITFANWVLKEFT